MADFIINTEPGHFYVTPVGFLAYSKDFYTAGINWGLDEKYSPVPYFLFCRSIELALKSFLLIKGEKVNKFKKRDGIRHDLVKALNTAETHNLSEFVITTQKERSEIEKANEYYKEDQKRFEYFDIKNLFNKHELPDLKVLREYSERLIKNINSFILSSA